MRRIIIYEKETHVPADIEVGDRIELIRGNGLREGESMGYVVITEKSDDGVLCAGDLQRY